MNDKEIVKLKLTNGHLTKTITVYESGIVKASDTDYKKIDIVDDIIKYLDIIKQEGYEKSALDDRCEIEYENEIYNSGVVYSNIELMIRNNCSLDNINNQNNSIRLKEKEKQQALDEKKRKIADNRSKIIDIYNNRLQLDIANLSDASVKSFEAIKFTLKKKDKFDIGESRVLSRYIDIPENVEFPNELEFLAQINLNELSKCDNKNILPKKGNLYFFQGPVIDETYYECGKVLYSDDNNLVRKDAFVYNDDMVLELGINNITTIQETYSEDNEKDNKIFGIYSDPQLAEKDILKVSNEYLVLLQLGWDIYGEGVITFLIKEEDLIKKDFSKVIYTYSQT